MRSFASIEKFFRENAVSIAACAVIAASVLYAFPSFWIPLGHPWEGDAVDYRIPLLKWILRHGTYPNWPWTPIEDYPWLGELLMLPFFALGGGLARLVPLAGYLLGAGYAGAIFWELAGKKSGLRRRDAILLGMAWILPLRPFAVQASLLMTDNLATAFCLGAVYHAMRGRTFGAGLLLALAMATKYFAWGASLAVFLSLGHALGWTRSGTARRLALFCLIGAFGALPFAIRNFLVNEGNPVFPMFVGIFGQGDIGLHYNLEGYGRGRGPLALLLFPYDFLVTHSFVRNLYDYEIGKLFLIQFAAALALAAWRPREFLRLVRESASDRATQAALLFSFVFFLAWFYTSQQMRFLLASVILWNLLLLVGFSRLAPRWALAALVLVGVGSLHSVGAPARRMVFGGEPSIFAAEVEKARDCFARAGLSGKEVIGHTGRSGILGFFDHDFVFVRPSVYRVDLPGKTVAEPEFVYDLGGAVFSGYERVPAENPCLWKKI